MDEKKYVKYEEPKKYGGYVEVDDLDVDCSTIKKTMRELILEATKVAVKENIKANSIILNKKYVKTPHLFVGDGFLPPMVCGLEVYMTADELPDNYSFALLEKPQTERERLISQAKAEKSIEILKEIGEMWDDNNDYQFKDYAWFEKLCKKHGVYEVIYGIRED